MRTALTMAAIFALIATAIVVVDPLGNFDTDTGDLRTFEYSPLVTANLVDKLRTKRFTLVFGTSRVRLLSRRYLGSDTLNFHVLYGNPRAILDLLQGLDATQARNIEKIYVLLDLHTLGSNAYLYHVGYDSTVNRFLYRGERIAKYLRSAVAKLWRNATGEYEHYVHPRGHTVPVRDQSNYCDLPVTRVEIFKPGKSELRALAAVEAFAKHRGIKIVFFSAPVSRKFYRAIDQRVLAEWRRAVSASISGYHDLLSMPRIIDDCSLWADTHHLNGRGTVLMLEAMALNKYFVSARQSADRK